MPSRPLLENDSFRKEINYKHVLHDPNIDDFKFKPPDCTCASSPFIYNPAGHVITGDFKIINDTSLSSFSRFAHCPANPRRNQKNFKVMFPVNVYLGSRYPPSLEMTIPYRVHDSGFIQPIQSRMHIPYL
jgi:hypothetical protein